MTCQYKKVIKKYIDEILDTKFKISELKEKYCHLGAFQTRNIPHQGHEKIIEMMLNHCDAVVINPIVGPKKPGDVNSEKLKYLGSINKFPFRTIFLDSAPKISFVNVFNFVLLKERPSKE